MNVNMLALMNGMHPDDTLRAGQRIRLSEGASTHTVRRRVEYVVREGDTCRRSRGCSSAACRSCSPGTA